MSHNDNNATHQPTFLQLNARDQNKILDGVALRTNRRDILRWLGMSGVGLVAGQAILASANAALAGTPNRGGRLRIAMHMDGKTLDPARQAAAIDYARGRTFFNALTRISPSNEAEPELAESFEHSSDGREWIFHLRKDVEFHDGKTLTAQDVVYSLMRHKDPATASTVKVLMNQVDSVLTDGANVIRIKLAAPNADLPLIFGTTQFAIIKDGEKDFFNPVGTGPYRLGKTFVPSSMTIGKRFGNYFKSGRPYLDEIDIFCIADSNARANALFSGDIDAATNLGSSALAEISKRTEFQILNTPSGAFNQFAMMCDSAPTDSLDFRLAVKNLLDRERFLTTVQNGYGQLGNDHVVPPNHPFYNKDLPQRTVDLDKAKFHLRKANLNGKRTKLFVSDAAPGSIGMGQMFQQSAARVGLTVDLQRAPADGYYSNVWMKKPFSANRWQARPTLDILLSLGWLSDAKWNDTSLKDPSFDKLVIEARGAVDTSKRKHLYGEIQRYLYERGGNAIYTFVNYRDALTEKIKGIKPNPISELGGYYFPDTAWFES